MQLSHVSRRIENIWKSALMTTLVSLLNSLKCILNSLILSSMSLHSSSTLFLYLFLSCISLVIYELSLQLYLDYYLNQPLTFNFLKLHFFISRIFFIILSLFCPRGLLNQGITVLALKKSFKRLSLLLATS